MNLDNPPVLPLSRRRFIASATALIASPSVFALSDVAKEMPSSGPEANIAADGSAPRQGSDDARIRPFSVRVPEAQLVDLRRRIAATRWPSRELVADASQGVQLATMRELARTWHADYSWRKFETRLNALPQFVTTIDGVDIHFIHIRSKHRNALPVIVTHGWPGSIVEQLKIIDPLTNPTEHGGNESDAFDIVIPSLPGHGFSGKPTTLG